MGKVKLLPAAGAAQPQKIRQNRQPAKKGRKPPPPNETARERFLRIGQPRVANAVHAIRLIGNLARGAYEWTERDVRLMSAALREAIEHMEAEYAAVQGTKAPSKEPVKFDFDRGLRLPTK